MRAEQNLLLFNGDPNDPEYFQRITLLPDSVFADAGRFIIVWQTSFPMHDKGAEVYLNFVHSSDSTGDSTEAIDMLRYGSLAPYNSTGGYSAWNAYTADSLLDSLQYRNMPQSLQRSGYNRLFEISPETANLGVMPFSWMENESYKLRPEWCENGGVAELRDGDIVVTATKKGEKTKVYIARIHP